MRQCFLTAQAVLLYHRQCGSAGRASRPAPRPAAQTCFQRIYDGRYVPGTPSRQGYVLADWKTEPQRG